MGLTPSPDRGWTEGQTIGLHVRVEDVPDLRGHCQAHLVNDLAVSRRVVRPPPKVLVPVLKWSSMSILVDEDMTFQKSPRWAAIPSRALTCRSEQRNTGALHAAVKRIQRNPHPISPPSPRPSDSNRFS